MEAREFHRDLAAWIDGELPPERAAAMQAAADASPELAERAALERRFDARMRRALKADPVSVETVRRMASNARRGAPSGRILGLPQGALRLAASFLVVVVTGMWWFCIPPFECTYMEALEKGARDPSATPGAAADDIFRRAGLPQSFGDFVAAPPPAVANLGLWPPDADAVRLDYVRADGSAVQVVACVAAGVHPSIRRRVTRDGESWWIADVGGRRVVAFAAPGGGTVVGVTGPAGDDGTFAAAKALRASLR